MPETKITDTNLDSVGQDFQIPTDNSNQSTKNQLVTDPNFANPIPLNDLGVNQIANKNLPPEQSNELKAEPVNPQQNQTTVYGKSELLNANEILAKILGIKTGNRVADLGSGGGMFTLQAARLTGDQGEVYAVDIIKPILTDIESKARMANLYNIKTIWSNIEILGATKIPENTLDYVLLINILFQSKETAKMIAEGTRLLKNGGKMLIIDWSDTSTGLGPRSDRQIDPHKLIEQAQKLNLTLEQQFIAGKYHFGLIFIK